MAAALRHAARRLGGRALQRPQTIYTPAVSPAVEDIPVGRIVWLASSRRYRSISSVAAHSRNSDTKHPCKKSAAKPSDQKKKEHLVSAHLKQVQKKKEELYHVIAELDNKFPSHCTKDNRVLLMDLAAHVQPKPNNLQWRAYRGAKRIKNCVLYGGVLFLSYVSVSDEISGLYHVLVD